MHFNHHRDAEDAEIKSVLCDLCVSVVSDPGIETETK
jgi:hypothetical protein